MFRAAQRQPAARLAALYKKSWLNHICQFLIGKKLEIYLFFFMKFLRNTNDVKVSLLCLIYTLVKRVIFPDARISMLASIFKNFTISRCHID